VEGDEVADGVSGIVYAETQVDEEGFDLTVARIFRPKGRGEIDFGGGERRDTGLVEVEPELRDPDDDYGWWELDPGSYLMEYNESIERSTGLVSPLKRLSRNLATHPTFPATRIDKVPLRVGGEGIAIKENARVSRLSEVR